MSHNYFVYDIETYPNVFTLAGQWLRDGEKVMFEISNRIDQTEELIDFLMWLSINRSIHMVGFNNLAFDYLVLHHILKNKDIISVEGIYTKAQQLIDTPWKNRFSNIIWDSDQIVPQIDLYKIHHFDNQARATSLKVIEFNLRMGTIQDLPYPPGSYLTYDQIDNLKIYNQHDVTATTLFCLASLPRLDFRHSLSEKYDINMMNFNDTKIGKSYFIRELEKHSPGCCYDTSSGKRKMRQTPRDEIVVKNILLPYIQFTHPEFKRVHRWFNQEVITNTKADFKVSATIKDFEFVFGTGGIHGSTSPCTVESTDTHMILDIDVKSYYPNLAIKNRFFPEHLSEKFCDIYSDVYDERQKYSKGTPENAMLKLALNGTYGDSNSPYSPLYDPQYTMAITINGQLLLCMLAEALMGSDDVLMIQINTDGMTIKFPRELKPWVNEVMDWWQRLTKLELEEVEYSRFFVRDVNNYIAVSTKGKAKRKGAYEYVQDWNKNHSALIVKKAAEAYLLHGTDIKTFIRNHPIIYDFFLRTKVPRNSYLVTEDHDGVQTKHQNVSRYYVSSSFDSLKKIMPPTANQMKKDPNAPDRQIRICVGYSVTICNNATEMTMNNVDYSWYDKEALKLVAPIIKGGII